MNFAELKKKLQEVTLPLKEKATPLFEKAKLAGFRAVDFTQKQLQNTPLVLKTTDEYTDFITRKRAILIAYDETKEESRELLVKIPIWSAQAWTDAAEIRLIEISKESELRNHLDIHTSVDMKVWYIGEVTFHGSDVESITRWWETRCYDGKSPEDRVKDGKSNTSQTPLDASRSVESAPKENTVDPLASVK